MAISPCPAAAAKSTPLYTYDLAPINTYNRSTITGKNALWAEAHIVAALQGLVNRTSPRLYLYYVSNDSKPSGYIDRFWLARMQEPGGWLAKKPIQSVPTLEKLVTHFRAAYRGVVLYDLSVPATSNVASTAAGCEDLLPIPYDPTPGSVYDRLVVHGPKLPIKLRLLKADGSPLFTGAETGSAKCDAYLWAKHRYLDTGKCNPALLAYYIDSWWRNDALNGDPTCPALCNHDYFIQHHAFFFDLSPWDDEAPRDDPKQPLGTDYTTLLSILRSAYDGTHGKTMIHVGGFVPWAWKYTTFAQGKHEGVASEWRYAAILSSYNAYMDADALAPSAMANASVYSHFPLKARYPQAKSGLADWKKAGYVDAQGKVVPRTYISFYVGDYDSAAWIYRFMPSFWTDPARGRNPLTWAFNPNLAERFPVGLDWARRTATPNDHFIAGDSGAGYINPGNLDGDRPFSHLPSGVAVWEAHCQRYYKQWDITLTGFVIDGESRPMSAETLAAYTRFSPDGFFASNPPSDAGVVTGTRTPYLRIGYDMPAPDQLDEAMRRVQAQLGQDRGARAHFHVFRTVLWSPAQHAQLIKRLEALPNVTIVDDYTLLGLLRQQELSH